MVKLRDGSSEIRVAVPEEANGRRVSGLMRCGSPWSCPHCAPIIRRRRANEVSDLARRAIDAGGSVLLATWTLPHRAGEPLAEVLERLQDAYRRSWQGRWSVEVKETFGIVGSVRAIEATFGTGSGWHPHLHVLVVSDRVLTVDEIEDLRFRMIRRWLATSARLGYPAPSRAHSVDLRPVDDPQDLETVAAYASGWDVGAEVAVSTVKLGRTEGRWSPWSLLASAALLGDSDAAALWDEWERATAGRRAIVASRGLYDRYQLEERTDLDLVEEDAVTKKEKNLAEISIPRETWIRLVEVEREIDFLDAFEAWARGGKVGPQPTPEDWIALGPPTFEWYRSEVEADD